MSATPQPQSSVGSHDAQPISHRMSQAQTLRVIRLSLVVLATIASLWLLQWGQHFFIPCAVAVFITFWLMPLVNRLQRWQVPRSLGAALVLFALIGGIGFTGYFLRDDARGFAASFPAAVRHARAIYNDAAHDPNGLIHHLRGAFTDRVSTGGKSRQVVEPVENTVDVQDAVLRGSSTVVSAAASIVVALFAIYLMLLAGDLFKRKLMVVVSRQVETGTMTRKRMTIEIIDEISLQFQRYLGVLAVTNIVIGLLTYAAFAALGVEHAAVWGVAAAVLHIIPYVGPAVITIASFLVAALQFDSLSQGLAAALSVLLIFCLIGMLFSTWLAGRASNMNSVAVFTGLMFWGWLWGIPGLLLGTPLMMAIKVVADRTECLQWLGIFLTDAPKRERKLQSATTMEAMADSAAMPVMSGPATLATEVAADGIDVEQLIATQNTAGDDDESDRDRHGKLFDPPPFPA